MKLIYAIALFSTFVVLANANIVLHKTLTFTGVGSTNTESVTLSKAGYVRLVDVQCSGDQFELSLDGQSVGTTSTPLDSSCSNPAMSEAEALASMRWSRGVFYLPSGVHSITIKNIKINTGLSLPVLVVSEGVENEKYVDQAATPVFTVITGSNKVQTRVEASDLCASDGKILANPTKQNWPVVSSAISKSTAIGSPDKVIIGSWDGNSYGSADLSLTVTKDASGAMTAAGVTLAYAPAYPLCQNDPNKALTPEYQAIAMDERYAVIGPGGPHEKHNEACQKVNMKPAKLGNVDQAACLQASNLVFKAAGQNSMAWTGSEDHEGLVLVLSTGATGGHCTINVPRYDSMLYYVCERPAMQRRSEL